jgi:hypothetical protein
MPKLDLRGLLALLCSELMISSLTGCGGHRVALPEARPPAQVFDPLSEELKKPYLTLFRDCIATWVQRRPDPQDARST